MAAIKNRRVANPIAVRRFAVVGDPNREVVLTLGKPRRYRGSSNEWVCSVLIEGIPKNPRRVIHGSDALQALQLAIEYARRRLDTSGLTLTWMDSGPGDVGIPRLVPSGWGLAFQHKLERYMDREAMRVARAAIAKGRRKRREGAS